MILLEGKKIAKNILAEIKREIAENGSQPGLGVVLVGGNEASRIYVGLKEKEAREVGIEFRKIALPENISQSLVLEEIKKLNDDKKIHGIIVQLPLPEGLDKNEIIQAIKPEKDADGFCEENLKNFFRGEAEILPVFPLAILELIKSSGQELDNKKALIMGNSEEFGKTMRVMLEKEGIYSEYILHDNINQNLDKIKKTDIFVTACGEAGLIKGDNIKDGAIVIDGGIIKIENKIFGDVDFESVRDKNIFLSPVPGGAGPVTIACLLQNVYLAYKKSSR
jgi:methylenetetrahydrofolate dehydrogenase (NADP+) / methenyltetrahydrofolate cyclohydrolase